MIGSRIEQFLGVLAGVDEEMPNKTKQPGRLPGMTGYPNTMVPHFQQPPVDQTLGQEFVSGLVQDYPAESSAATVDDVGV